MGGRIPILCVCVWALAGAGPAAAELVDLGAAARDVNRSVSELAAAAARMREAKEAVDSHEAKLGGRQLWQLKPAESEAHVRRLGELKQAAIASRRDAAKKLGAYRTARRAFDAQAAALRALQASATAALGRIRSEAGFHRSNKRRAAAAIERDLPLPNPPLECAREEVPLSPSEMEELLPFFARGGSPGNPRARSAEGLGDGFDKASALAREFRLSGMRLKDRRPEELPSERVPVCSAEPTLAGLAPIDAGGAEANLRALEANLRQAGPRKLRGHPWPGLAEAALFGKVAPDPSIDVDGTWVSENYNCERPNIRHRVAITHEGGKIVATKITGDECVKAGEVTWYGDFDGLPGAATTFPVTVRVTHAPGGTVFEVQDTASYVEERGVERIQLRDDLNPLVFTRVAPQQPQE